MAVACGRLSIATTDTVGTAKTVSGLSFQPTAIFYAYVARSGIGAAEADLKFGYGFAVSTSSRRAYCAQSDHAVGTSATDRRKENDCCIATQTTTGAIDGKADQNSFTSDGFTIIVDDQFAVAVEIMWMAWDATNAQIVDFDLPSSTGNQDISTSFALNTGADDKVVILAGLVDQFATNNTFATLCLGMAAGDTPVNALLAGFSDDAAANMVTGVYCRTGECMASAETDAVTDRASLTAWLSTGFRLNWSEVSGSVGPGGSALVMQGGNRWAIGDASTATNLTNFTDATSYQPTGIIVASACKTAASTADTTQAEREHSLGFGTSSTNRFCVSFLDDDAPTTSDIGVGFHDDRIYNNFDEANANKSTVEGAMDLVAFNSAPNVEFVMDDADPTARFFWDLITANVPGAAVGAFPFQRRARCAQLVPLI